MQIYLALDDQNQMIGYYTNGHVYETIDDIPIKRGLFKSSAITIIADMAYKGGRIINLATEREANSEVAYYRQKFRDIIEGDAFTRALQRR